MERAFKTQGTLGLCRAPLKGSVRVTTRIPLKRDLWRFIQAAMV